MQRENVEPLRNKAVYSTVVQNNSNNLASRKLATCQLGRFTALSFIYSLYHLKRVFSGILCPSHSPHQKVCIM